MIPVVSMSRLIPHHTRVLRFRNFRVLQQYMVRCRVRDHLDTWCIVRSAWEKINLLFDRQGESFANLRDLRDLREDHNEIRNRHQ